jgi:hypothetical protein
MDRFSHIYPPKVLMDVMQNSPEGPFKYLPVETGDCLRRRIVQNYDSGFVAAIEPPIRADSPPANATDPTAVETIKDAITKSLGLGHHWNSKPPLHWRCQLWERQ